MSGIELGVQNASTSCAVPPRQSLQRWVSAATGNRVQNVELCIRIVDEPEMAQLNEQYRHKHGSTNVLAFPQYAAAEVGCDLLGDIVICAPVVEREAKQQGKSSPAHWAHIVVHGVLHLLGYDHNEEAQAQRMEQLETEILTTLEFPPPYEANDAFQLAGDIRKQ